MIKHDFCLIGFITYHSVDALSDLILTDINWTLAALAFILMSVHMKSDNYKMAKLNTYNECIRPFISSFQWPSKVISVHAISDQITSDKVSTNYSLTSVLSINLSIYNVHCAFGRI